MTYSLSGAWESRPDPGGSGIGNKWFSKDLNILEWRKTSIPGCWNSDLRYERYEGLFWYRRLFDVPVDILSDPGMEIGIRFNAVNYFCRVWMNGEELGSHEGGFLPFEFLIRKNILRQSGNLIVVMVENFRAPDRVPGELFDWFNYGGITRDVELIIRNGKRFSSVRITSRITGDAAAVINISWKQNKPFSFSWRIEDRGSVIASGVSSTGKSEGMIYLDVDDIVFWSPDTPRIYFFEATPEEAGGADGFSTRFGIREIRIEDTGIILNGKRVRMKGVSLHEELPPFGRSIPRDERFREVRDIKSLGFNAIRTAHYTHDEALLDAADEIGLLVLEEIPVYWDLDYYSAGLFKTASNMIREMIERDFNHPSVVLWSVGNEVPVERPDCDRFIRGLMDVARNQDSSRIVTYVSSRFLIDRTRRASDVCCLNCYLGWYYGNEKDLKNLLEMARETAPDKPWIMTEFGACAKYGFRSRARAKFSEERQSEFIRHYVRTLNSLDWISGWFIWIYRDFRSPLRTHRRQGGFNRKGLVSETGRKKLICSSFPKLIDEKYDIAPEKPTALKRLVFEKLEELACSYLQPPVARLQKKPYDDFYRGKQRHQ